MVGTQDDIPFLILVHWKCQQPQGLSIEQSFYEGGLQHLYTFPLMQESPNKETVYCPAGFGGPDSGQWKHKMS